MLSLKNVGVQYGGVQALKGISLDIPEGTITCLIGANGAGKSTTLRAISGMVPLSSGEIEFEGHRIDGLDPEEIVDLGIGHVPEGKKLFLEMNIRDNLLLGAYLRRNNQRIQEDLKRICRFFPVLETAFNRPASQMSGGEQQMLAIGRGLMSAPRLLLLDEPSLGLSPLLTQEVGRIIKQIADEGVSILLIEQNASLALSLAQKGFVLETGSIVLEGSGNELQNDKYIKKAYLGLEDDAASPTTTSMDEPAYTGRSDAADTVCYLDSEHTVATTSRPAHFSAEGEKKAGPPTQWQRSVASRLDNVKLNFPATCLSGRTKYTATQKPKDTGRSSGNSRLPVHSGGRIRMQTKKNGQRSAKIVKKVYTPRCSD